MRRTKEELDEDRAALQRIMRAEQRRRNELRNKAALYGFNADPSIALELVTIEQRLQTYEAEAAALETLAAEAEAPVTEVQYRIAVAEAWNTSEGRPSVVSAARLELERLRLGVGPERAQQIEQMVRADLAREAIHGLNISALLGQFDNIDALGGREGMTVNIEPHDGGTVYIQQLDMRQVFAQMSPYDAMLRIIGRAVRLDQHIALQLLVLLLPAQPTLLLQAFGARLLEVNQVAIYPDERPIFEGFITELASALEHRTPLA